MRETILMKKNSGFTLMEVMVTIGIIAIMSAIAIPNYISWLPKHRMSGATRDVYSAMQYARMRAVKEKTRVTISFSIGTDDYTVFIDDGRGGGIANNNIADGTETVKTGQMPVDVDLFNAAFGAASRSSFNSRGLPVQIGNVELRNVPRQLYRRVVLRISGNPVIRTSTDGGATWN